jgi:PBSX family phage portal protein
MKDKKFEEFSQRAIEDRMPLVKAICLDAPSGEIGASNIMPSEQRVEDSQIFERTGALVPPYAGMTLCQIYENSNSLRQNIDSYVVNIDGHGHRFEPVIDLEADESFEVIRDIIFLDRLYEAREEGTEVDIKELKFPTDSEVEEHIKNMEVEMRLEKAKLDSFFRYCCIDESFISLRKKTRNDLEIMGNAYWEVIRDKSGQIVQFTYVPGTSMRLLPLDKILTPTIIKIKRTKITYEDKEILRRFRKFVQIHEGCKVYFKEFGDPRVISALTGEVYKTYEELQNKEKEQMLEGDVPQATEIIHFNIHTPKSPYGIPRWIGGLLSVLGSRQSEEVNFLYFENKSVPPLACLVSGGRLSESSHARLEDYIKAKIHGRKNFHKILIIEGVPAGTSALDTAASGARMKIELIPLMDAQSKDALFQNYDERNIDKVGMTFRLPRLLRGDIRDFNRATADAALEFTETQVFAPERGDFDWFINWKIFSDLEIQYWLFASNSPTTSNPKDLSDIIVNLIEAGIIIPEEARELIQNIFNKDFKKIEEVWTKVPIEILKLGILPEGEELPNMNEPENDNADEPEDEPEDDNDDKKTNKRVKFGNKKMLKLANDILSLRNYIDKVEDSHAKSEFDKSKELLDQEPEVIKVPISELEELFDDE